MRSRYSAYALAQGRGHDVDRPSPTDYLLKTWHPSTAPGGLALEPMQWTGLDVRHQHISGDTGVVEFVAHHKVNGRAGRLHERSRFAREGGAWLYVDGVVAPDAQGQAAGAAR